MKTQSAIPAVPAACIACGTALPADATFCPGCGRRVHPVSGHGSVPQAPRPGQPLTREPSTDEQTRPEWAGKELPPRYRPVQLLGRGGMGVVFHCQDTLLERPVAIKLMSDRYRTDPKAERRFLREARAQAVINHPNVATVLDVGLTGQGRPFIVMEFIEGRDLRQVIREHPAGFDPERACLLLEQACRGLTAAHAAGIVHRDLKPSNLMLWHDAHGGEQVKILDLGLAKIAGGVTDLRTITVDTVGILVGTPAYMSPEQVSGTTVDGRADLYALGVVFFELLTGRLPFESETLEGWLFQHLHATPPPPSRLQKELARCPELDALALWVLAKSPQERPQSAEEFAAALARVRSQWLRSGQPGPAPPAAPFAAFLPGATALAPPPPPRRMPLTAPATGAPETPAKLPPLPPGGSSAALPAFTGLAAGELPAPTGSPAAPAPGAQAAEEAERVRHDRFLALSKAAEAAEAEGKWEEAVEHWRQAVRYSDGRPGVISRLESLKRALAFEQVLSSMVTLAAAGEWARAEATLASAATMYPEDPRVEQARARLPRRLVEGWLESARVRLNHFPAGPAREGLLRRIAATKARFGDLAGAVRWLQEETQDVELRIRGLAEAACAAVQTGAREGMRPYLERALSLAGGLEDPHARGRAYLDLGRALTAYGDVQAATTALQQAVVSFQAAGRGGPSSGGPSSGGPSSGGSSPHPAPKPGSRLNVTHTLVKLSALRTTKALPVTRETDWETAVAAVAEAQAEAGQPEVALQTAGQLEDPWTRSQCIASIAQHLARTGRAVEAEHAADCVTFRLPRARALRAVALANIYGGDLEAAELIARELVIPDERAPVQALLMAARLRRGDAVKAHAQAKAAMATAKELPPSPARLSLLLAIAEPLLNAGATAEAKPFLDSAGRLVDGMENPAERVLGLLSLVRTRAMAAPKPGDPAGAGAPQEAHEALRRALVSLRLIHGEAERQECLERAAHAIADTGAAPLAAELLSQCLDECERAVVYAGLAAGMV